MPAATPNSSYPAYHRNRQQAPNLNFLIWEVWAKPNGRLKEGRELQTGNEDVASWSGGRYVHRKVLGEKGGVQYKHRARWGQWGGGRVPVVQDALVKLALPHGSAWGRLGTAGIQDAKSVWESTGLIGMSHLRTCLPIQIITMAKSQETHI